MENQPILARISIGIHKQGDVAIIYGFDTLKLITSNISDIIDGMINLHIDSEFEYNDKRYKVTRIQTLFYDHLQLKVFHQAGANLYGSDEPQDYNVEIMYFVEEN